MAKFITKKRVVLLSLFILPLIFFLVLSTGVNNFKRLPVVTENVKDFTASDSVNVKLQEQISVVCFLGNDIESSKGGIFNLNQKIYKPFYGFKNFQLLVIHPISKIEEAKQLKKSIAEFTNVVNWKLVALDSLQIQKLYSSLNTNDTLQNLGSNRAFIIDKDVRLRGRINDEDEPNGILFGYNMNSVAELNNKMKDDVKIVLAEYRLAFKRKNNGREI